MHLAQGCGAFTGEMAVDQMKEMGCKACLIGHSERRGEFGLPTPAESCQLLATKLKYILDAGLMCIFAIGEPLPIREKGIEAVVDYCKTQLVDILPILKELEDKMWDPSLNIPVELRNLETLWRKLNKVILFNLLQYLNILHLEDAGSNLLD